MMEHYGLMLNYYGKTQNEHFHALNNQRTPISKCMGSLLEYILEICVGSGIVSEPLL
jgi:hypothetical protein